MLTNCSLIQGIVALDSKKSESTGVVSTARREASVLALSCESRFNFVTATDDVMTLIYELYSIKEKVILACGKFRSILY